MDLRLLSILSRWVIFPNQWMCPANTIDTELNCSFKKRTFFEGKEVILDIQDMPPPQGLNDTQHVDLVCFEQC